MQRQNGKKSNGGKKFQFVVSAVIACFCVALLWAPVSAFAVEEIQDDEIRDYASELITGMLLTDDYENKFDLEARGDEYEIGRQIPVFFEDDNGGILDLERSIWPIFNSGHLALILETISGDDGDTVFRLTTQGVEALSEAMGNTEITSALIGADGEWRFLGDDMSVPLVVEGPADGAISEAELSQKSANCHRIPIDAKGSSGYRQDAYTNETLGEEDTEGLLDAVRRSASRSVSINPQLKVGKTMQGNLPICWAGATSSVGWYLTGVNKTAEQIAKEIKGGNYGGTTADIVKGLALFKYPSTVTPISAKVKSASLSDAEIKRWIDNGVPVIAELSSSSSKHAIVVCGWYTTASGSFAIYAMNPGHGAYEIMTKNGSNVLQLWYNQKPFAWSSGTVVPSGWQRPYGGSKWSYFYDTGARATKWLKDNGSWYYLDASGYMLVSRWLKDGGYWYYLGKYGAMVTGWQKIDGYWYYMNSSGAMQKGWIKTDGKWYYLRPSANKPASGPEGAMLSGGSWTIDGKLYTFDGNGACLNP